MDTLDELLAGYCDYAATAPPFPAALEAQAAAAREWFGNPSSGHRPGQAAKAELQRLKAVLAGKCSFTDGRVVLTSGATEANSWVIHSIMTQTPAGRVLVAADVHDSVWKACRGFRNRMDVLGLESDGRLSLASLARAWRSGTRLFCCSHVANETGVIHDVAALANQCERKGAVCLVDGVQAMGHLPVNLADIPCEFYTFAAHKFGGPRGCGGVFLRMKELPPLLAGGPQEWGLRPGTENLAGLAGAVTALETSLAALPAEADRLRHLARSLLDELRRAGLTFELNGDPETGLPGLLSISFPGLSGQTLAADLAVQGFAVASGSACHSDQPEPSRVMLALGRAPATALGTLRMTFGRHNREEVTGRLAAALAQTVKRHTIRAQ